MCRRSFFSCKDNTLAVWTNNVYTMLQQNYNARFDESTKLSSLLAMHENHLLIVESYKVTVLDKKWKTTNRIKDMLDGPAGVEDFLGGIVWVVTLVVWGLLCHFDRQMLFPLCFWSTRDHS